ncbi:MAG TPA: hypothetical protein VMZ28_23120, partial [Kofleriaceae bacterium]|nr:hypothetical protein [Kofleriaceae bacterium]
MAAKRAAAVGAVIALAGCLDAPPSGNADAPDDDAGVVSAPDAGADCQIADRPCVAAADFHDSFGDLSAWEIGGDQCDFDGGDGMRITRNGGSYCVARTTATVDLRCSSVHVHLDPVASAGSDASLSFISNENYYYIERKPPTIEVGVCPPLQACTTLAFTDYDPAQHLRWRLRASATQILAEVGGPDEGLTWTLLGAIPGVDPGELVCGTVELGNYMDGDTPSVARF